MRRIADGLRRLAEEIQQPRMESNMHLPAEADDLVGQAYNKLASFKSAMDTMEEIPDHLMPIYRQATKAMNVVGNARQETNQLKEMVRREFRRMGG